MEWSVNIEFATAIDEERADEFADDLAEHSPAITVTDDTTAFRLWVEAATAMDALTIAASLLIPSFTQPVVDLHATKWNRFSDDLASSNMPALLGAAEVESMLGVTRQRLHQIRKTHDFPAPLTHVAATPLWTRAGIQAFIDRWDRTPGRPVAAPKAKNKVTPRRRTKGATTKRRRAAV